MRADHPFDAESDSELSLAVGDMIAVLDEVDAGWYIGEIVGDEARTGMFPATYCSVVDPPRRPPKPPSPTKSESVESLDDQVTQLSLRRPISNTGTSPRPGVARTVSASSTTSSSPNPAKMKKPPPPPVSRGSKPSLASSGATAVDMRCRECGCTEFRANVFKKGSCNNCFHVHVPQ